MRIAFVAGAFALVSSTLYADPLPCTMTGYKALPGLSAAVTDNTLALTWEGDKNQDVRLRLTLANGTKQSMNVPRMVYTQGGRVLIACDNITVTKDINVPHRINLWDTATGSIAHQIALPSGLPTGVDVTPTVGEM